MADAKARADSRWGLLVAAGSAFGLALIFWVTGALTPTKLPSYATSQLQVTGMALMLILVPSYMIAALSIARQRSLALIEQIRPLLPAAEEADAARRAVRSGLSRHWKAGAALGIVFGLLNTNPIASFTEDPAPSVAGSISIGQLLMWVIIGLLIAERVAVAQAFRRLGESIRFDLFRLDDLRPLSRSGMIDIVIVAGALLLSPLQSLDAEFRWYNYRFALLIAVPATFFYLTWPLLGVHRRIRGDRDARVAALDAEIAAPAGSGAEETVRREILLAHRDRLLAARTWPLSTALLSRVLLYLVFPPLAWAGAALVERLIESALG